MKTLHSAFTAIMIILITFGILIASGFFKKESTTENRTETEESRSPLSRVEDYIDSLKQRRETILLDTIIVRFGNHPGSTSYDTVYKISYETINPIKANRAFHGAKKYLGKK